jgi:dTDP-4-amino-4,6-dideoxygalactose transaminase
MNDITIPFNKPHLTHKEIGYINHAHSMGKLAGDGYYTKLCHEWIEKHIGGKKALLTHSCTGALEMMAILSDIQPGEEVIMPSFTFVSTANAYVLRGAIPVFIDIRPDTLNMDERLIEQAITKKTRVLSPVHYAGVGCEMDTITAIAKKHKLLVVEDAAQGFLSKYKGKNLGTLGDMSAFSFHETKNVISGEGGALVINNEKFAERAEIIREKGTNRSKFFRGQVDKYTWVDVGSSYLPGEIIAAFLMAQLENAEEINKRRLEVWQRYHTALAPLEKKGVLRRPFIPDTCEHNGHMYYILTNDGETRTKLIEFLKTKGILSVFHYIPLHSAPAGKKFARYVGDMSVTDRVSDTLLRLPLFYNLTDSEQDNVISAMQEFFTGKKHE